MCGRVIQSSGPLKLAIVDGLNVRDSRLTNHPPRYNAAPSQELLVIRRNRKIGEVSLDPLRWGLIPYWCNDPKGGRKPINAKAETVATLPMFREAYARRRCLLPVDGFFEWMAIKGTKAKQPFAIAMRDGSPFGIAGIWETGRTRLESGSERSQSSRCGPTTSWVKFTIVCRPFCARSSMIAGWATTPIRATCHNLTRPNSCACGQSQLASTSRRMTIRRSLIP
jgi:putative SOS response-associated peptidase YedK